MLSIFPCSAITSCAKNMTQKCYLKVFLDTGSCGYILNFLGEDRKIMVRK